MEIVQLVGADVLPDDQKLTIEIGRVIRLGFLQQNAFHKEDTYVPLAKQLRMMEIIIYLYEQVNKFVQTGKALSLIKQTQIFEEVIQMKYNIKNNELHKFDILKDRINHVIQTVF